MRRYFFLFLFLCSSSLSFGKQTETTVEAERAHYDGTTITLEGNVRVFNAMGTIFSQKALLKKDESHQTKLDFPWVELSNQVTLYFPKGEKISCDRLEIDYTKMTSLFKGSDQVVFKNESYEIMADVAVIDYEEKEGSIKPLKIHLKENVRMINLGTAEKPEEQYALADEVTYFPDEEFMILEGKRNKVLFYDKKKEMRLSTQIVHAERNKETKQESIRGIGDVRFVFGSEELEKIKNRFKAHDEK